MDNRYDLLPSYYYKDSEDGKLTKSVGKPLRGYKIYGESFQRQLPTPETPVAIDEVGEKYEYLVDETGENLFPVVDGTNIVNGIAFTGKNGTVTCSYESGAGYGVVSAKNFTVLSNYISYATISESCSFFLKAGTYEFSYDREGSTAFKVMLIVGDIGTSAMSGETKALNYENGAIISVAEDTYCMPVYGGSTSSVSSATFTNISLKKKVAVYKYRVPVKSYGKNIADPIQIREFVERMNAVGTYYTDDAYVNIFTDENGREILKFHAASAVGHSNATELRTLFKGIFKPNTQYTISFDYYRNNTFQAMNMGVLYTDGTRANFGGCGGVKNQVYNYKWTTAAGKTISSIQLEQHGETNFIYLDTFQIEEGTTKTDYEECIGTRYIYLDEPLRKVLEPPTSYTNIVDIDYILENNPYDTTSLKREAYQDRDCLRFNAGSKASSLRIMQGKFKENTDYTIRLSAASSANYGSIIIRYTDGFLHEIRLQQRLKDMKANVFGDIVVFTRKGKTVDYICGGWSAGEWISIDVDKFTIVEGTCKTNYFPQKSTIYNIPVYSNYKNIANPIDIYHFVRNINTVSGTAEDGQYIAIDEDGREWLNNSASTGYGKEGYKEAKIVFNYDFKENTQYTFSFDCRMTTGYTNLSFIYTDGSVQDVRHSDWVDGSTICNVSSTSMVNKTVDYICLGYASGASQIYLDTIQLEEGTVETEYVPYVLRNVTHTLPFGVRGYSDYSDHIDFKNRRVVRRVKKLVATGEQSVSRGGDNKQNIYGYYTNELRMNTSENNNLALCSHLPMGISKLDEQCVVAGATNTYIYLFLDKEKFPDVTAVQTYLAEQYANGTPVTVYYLLSEEQYEPLELPQIRTNKGDCTVSVDITIKPSKTEYQYYRGGK